MKILIFLTSAFREIRLDILETIEPVQNVLMYMSRLSSVYEYVRVHM